MKKLACFILFAAAAACGGQQHPGRPADPKEEVKMLMTLFQENRSKFVVQKQEMIDKDCDRATTLRTAADEMIQAEALQPTKNETLTMVQMELAQAEKACNDK